jgi:hypothetical protein
MPRTAVLDVGSDGVSTNADDELWPLLPPTLLTIHRTCAADEQTRQIICALDGRRIGQLLFGETLTCEIVPGAHVLRVNNTLVWKSFRFEAEPADHVHVTVWNKALGGYVLMLAFLGAAPLGLGVAPGRPAVTGQLPPAEVAAHAWRKLGR